MVLIPPPVDPGEAPTHISAIVSIKAGIPIAPTFTLLKPAVRGVEELKKIPLFFQKGMIF